ncbi:LuxR C-terminal-related transcriptional regulator [Salipiger sp. P9]|uniref:helix-turn-helix transcriptional regulator n=1 Tax=Salipiger pentaromativorans TaxID=2943193 RepID=UPI00215798AB|nr:LuxR C-terminal-related transcriptional regulator [Salipiger pentaromativorans]MCR8549198.1 LuxR C-terminal-related transcriptional regulator [Salipiger pentaromativorans]
MIFTRIDPWHPEATKIIDRLGGIVEAAGSDLFAAALAGLLLDAIGAAGFAILRREGRANALPHVTLLESRAPLPPSWAEAYAKALFGDPAAAPQPGADGPGIHRIAASGIRAPMLRSLCFTGPGFAEALTLAQGSGTDLIALSILADRATGGFSAFQHDELNQLGKLLLPILRLHVRLAAQAVPQRRVSAGEMEERVAATFPELTRREVAVCARSVLGVTAEGIALDLGIKQTSVRTYRLRAYTRLNINSINQLSTMLIQS